MKTASWRYILFLLSFLGIFASGSILWMLFWMSARIETIEHQKTHALLSLNLAETAQTLRLGLEDYAFWTLAYDLVNQNDAAGILNNLGSGATDSQLFDQLFIVDADGTLLHAFDEELGAEAGKLFDEQAFEGIWTQLQDLETGAYTSFVTVARYADGYALIAGAWITPDDFAERPTAKFPALLGVIKLDTAYLEALTKNAQVNAVVLEDIVSTDPASAPAYRLTIYDIADRPVVTLAWTMPSTGKALRRELLPAVLLMGLSILGICGSAARYFRSQHGALRQAKVVATTDQLTGLLNRAGLAERLRQKDAQGYLERGDMAAIYLDLNKFKVLNDNYGHMAGDIALRVMADRLQAAARKSDFVARLGGDEFVCVITDDAPEEAAVQVAERILKLALAPIKFEGHSEVITPAVGIAAATAGMLWETLLSQSDAAMYWAKQKSATYPVVFCKSMDAGTDTIAELTAQPATPNAA